MTDQNLVNLANVTASELRAMMIPNLRLFRTGNMKRSVAVVEIDEKTVDVVIATDYASYTDTRGKWAGWVSRTVSKACSAFCSANNVEDLSAFGMVGAQVLYGG